jgi:hypothetical protein
MPLLLPNEMGYPPSWIGGLLMFVIQAAGFVAPPVSGHLCLPFVSMPRFPRQQWMAKRAAKLGAGIVRDGPEGVPGAVLSLLSDGRHRRGRSLGRDPRGDGRARRGDEVAGTDPVSHSQ